MIKAIVYTSSTGSTARYAAMAADAAGLPSFALDGAEEKLRRGDEIFYMGWMMRGRVRGYARAAMTYCVPGLCGIGMMRQTENTLREMRQRMGLSDLRIKVFYAQAGFDMQRLGGAHRLMMETLGRRLAEQGDERAREALNMLHSGGDHTAFENIAPAVGWIKKYNGRQTPPA